MTPFEDEGDAFRARQEAYLQALGCDLPSSHGRKKHRCPLYQNRLACLRELRRHDREVHLLEKLTSGRLPEELVITILECLAAVALSSLELTAQETLARTTRKLLGPAQGNPKLCSVLEQTLLESVTIQLFPVFERHKGGLVVARMALPPDLLSNIRRVNFRITINTDLQYPTKLFRATAGMRSLSDQLTNVKWVLLDLIIEGSYQYRHSHGSVLSAPFSAPCHIGYREIITYRDAVEKLIQAMQACDSGAVRPRLKLHFPNAWPKFATGEVGIDGRPAAEILARAVEPAVPGRAAPA